MYTPVAANIGYTPSPAGPYRYGMPPGYYPTGYAGGGGGGGGTSMIAPDGTLSLASVADAVTRVLQKQAQKVSQLQQQNDPNGDGGGGGGNGGQGGSGGVGSASMLALQKSTGEYTTALQQGTAIMAGVNDAHKAVSGNTK